MRSSLCLCVSYGLPLCAKVISPPTYLIAQHDLLQAAAGSIPQGKWTNAGHLKQLMSERQQQSRVTTAEVGRLQASWGRWGASVSRQPWDPGMVRSFSPGRVVGLSIQKQYSAHLELLPASIEHPSVATVYSVVGASPPHKQLSSPTTSIAVHAAHTWCDTGRVHGHQRLQAAACLPGSSASAPHVCQSCRPAAKPVRGLDDAALCAGPILCSSLKVWRRWALSGGIWLG